LGPEFALDLSGCPAHDGSVTGHADDSLTIKIGSIANHAARSARRIEADAMVRRAQRMESSLVRCNWRHSRRRQLVSVARLLPAEARART
jgi:hypothetical protein